MRKRSKYRPKLTNALSYSRLISSRKELERSEQVLISLSYHTALVAVMAGKGALCDLETLGQAANMAVVLTELDVGEEYLNLAKTAQEAVLRAMERYKKHGSAALDGLGIVAINNLLDLLDAQIENATVNQIEASLNETVRRMRAGEVLNGVAA